jgi:hypothetical protein
MLAMQARPLSAQLRPSTPGLTARSGVALKPLRRAAFYVRPRAAAGEPEEGASSELQRGVLLGVLMAKAFGKSDSQPAVETESVKPGGVVSAALAALVGPVFDKIAGSLVDAFVKRAEQVYG